MIKVNLITKEATREPLPKFLKGLRQESLNDLSWTDASLGVQGFGFWQEQDVSNITDTQLYDGTETYEVDEISQIVKVSRGIREKTQEELFTEFKAPRIAEIKARLDQIDLDSVRPLRAINTGTAAQFDTDKLAALDLEAKSLRSELVTLL